MNMIVNEKNIYFKTVRFLVELKVSLSCYYYYSS